MSLILIKSDVKMKEKEQPKPRANISEIGVVATNYIIHPITYHF